MTWLDLLKTRLEEIIAAGTHLPQDHPHVVEAAARAAEHVNAEILTINYLKNTYQLNP